MASAGGLRVDRCLSFGGQLQQEMATTARIVEMLATLNTAILSD
jgi:hypothetical protein